ncbi:hypothetical protein [Lignipirellula cremea]|uniref:SPOR domain-containing protein n=1 Tax=Lignipirellula cremea TaxID=2528010 RepID=A0A518DSD4_9BACT|nr:hypothetical protein [Lignipirellula cremea]QDU94753.1 hypothetical protein Pla8534_25600 [Lignipirellula cremea]
MVANNSPHTLAATTPIAVSSAGGGQAPQYRVQYAHAGQDLWRMHSLFRRREQAERCASELQKKGLAVRVVKYRICPSAA